MWPRVIYNSNIDDNGVGIFGERKTGLQIPGPSFRSRNLNSNRNAYTVFNFKLKALFFSKLFETIMNHHRFFNEKNKDCDKFTF